MGKLVFLRRKSSDLYKVLIVEEDSTVSDFCLQNLNNVLYEFCAVRNGEEIQQYCELHTPDIVLIDTSLTLTNAFSVLGMIRLDAKLSALPVIMVSALQTCDEVQKGIELGATDYIFSPFDSREFKAKIAKAIDSSK